MTSAFSLASLTLATLTASLALAGSACATGFVRSTPLQADFGHTSATVTVNVIIPEILRLEVTGFGAYAVPVRATLDGKPGLKPVQPDGIGFKVTSNTSWSLVITTSAFQGPAVLPASRLEWNAGAGWVAGSEAPRAALCGAGRLDGRLGLRFEARAEDPPGDYESLVTLTLARL